MAILIPRDNNPAQMFDHHTQLRCPNCGVEANASCVSPPHIAALARFKPKWVAVGYRCDACNGPLHFNVLARTYDRNQGVFFDETLLAVVRGREPFDFEFVPDEVANDFREALICFAEKCFNAFAAMCRRTIQSAAEDLGAKGKDKVDKQVQNLKDAAEVDEETFGLLKQIVVDGHDGAHPHLPKLSGERAGVLLALMKDVLYQLYVRKGKLEKAVELRREAIERNRSPEE